ncbi:hydrolase [Streptomyces bungoensis]|uniref:Hydrolase n=1 Tax=Streptomyces bungoensis TaxID=285568 RepID=A0A117RA31_9ACTN|nr:ricin-type beta-trefoil lectin domain protein [Streptomyces bungoensis]KUN79410.1 hydrolase [Streptomyces bungoensis]
MNEAGPSDSVPTPRRFDVSDEQLSAELKKWTGTTPALHPVGELLDRHWEAAFAYARLCTDGPRAAGMLTTAAFTRLFGESIRQAGPSAAWRPHLLVTVRRIAAEWDGDGRQELLHPALRSHPGTGERASARLLPPSSRRLLSRAFQRLPQSSRAVLWHAEVEAEPLAVPAALLGLDEEDALIELRRAVERLREECLQVHRELAPEAECRRYQRMLDVTFRRGGVDIDPDLQRHLSGCGHCSRTADQLARFNGGLGLALAEAVLGWGASAYVESRAARPEQPTPPPPASALSVPPGGESFTSAGVAEPPGAAGGMPGADGVQGADAGPAGRRSRRAARGTRAAAGGGRAKGFTPAAEGRSGAADSPPAAPGAQPGPGAAPRTDGRPAGAGSAPSLPPGWDAWDAGSATEPGPSPAAAWEADAGPAPARPRRSARRAGAGPRAEGPGRAAPGADPVRSARAAGNAADPTGPGTSRRSAQRAARRVRRRNLALAAATVSGLVVLPLVLWSVLGAGDDPAPGGGGTPSRTPGRTPATPRPSWAGTSGDADGVLRGRLHNLASGLCVGVTGGKAVKGAETELARCSAAAGQQWEYETDGLLRNASAPDLCLDSHLGYSVRLAPCTSPGRAARSIRYDFTLQGVLVPRSDQDLALTPAATDGSGALVLKNRTTAAVQRWTVDTARPDLEMQIVDWDTDSTPSPTPPPPVQPAPKASRTPSPTPTATAAAPTAATPSGSPGTDYCTAYPAYCDWGGGGYGGGGYGDGTGRHRR